MGFQLTSENYYSDIANYEYMSVSQFKDFAGTYGKLGCEECAMAKIRGKYKEPDRTALLEGSYVDSFYEGTLDKFKEEHAELFRQDGELKANFIKAEKAIARSLRDPLFQEYMSGEKQVIMTGELFGSKWKIKMDSYHPGRAIVDLKYMQSLTKFGYVPDIGYLDFVRYWGYDLQGAIYQEIVYQNTGNAEYGEEVRSAFISCMEKIHEENESYNNIKTEVAKSAATMKQQVEAINTKSAEVQKALSDLATSISNGKNQQTALETATKNGKSQQTNLENATEKAKKQQTATETATANGKSQETALQKVVDNAKQIDSAIQTSVSAANAAAANANQATSLASTAAGSANQAASTANTAAGNADKATKAANEAEKARANAESSRVRAEETRSQAETARTNAETARANSETTRNQNEEKRQADTADAIAKAKEATELLVNQANTIAFRINEGDSGLDVVILSA